MKKIKKEEEMFFGVCSTLSDMTGIDVRLIRATFVLGAILTDIGFGSIYFLLWLVFMFID